MDMVTIYRRKQGALIEEQHDQQVKRDFVGSSNRQRQLLGQGTETRVSQGICEGASGTLHDMILFRLY